MKKASHTAEDIMNRSVNALRGDTPAVEAVAWLAQHGYSGAPVVDEGGHLQGVFSEHDALSALLEAVSESRPVGTVASYMTKEVIQVPPNKELVDVALDFIKGKHRRVVVADNKGKLLGLITRRDLTRGLLSVLDPGKRVSTYDILRGLWR